MNISNIKLVENTSQIQTTANSIKNAVAADRVTLRKTIGDINYTLFIDAIDDPAALNKITEDQWKVLKAKYSSKAGLNINKFYLQSEEGVRFDDNQLANGEKANWIYNLQLMVNAFEIEHKALALLSNPDVIKAISIAINSDENISKRRNTVIKRALSRGSDRFNDIIDSGSDKTNIVLKRKENNDNTVRKKIDDSDKIKFDLVDGSLSGPDKHDNLLPDASLSTQGRGAVDIKAYKEKDKSDDTAQDTKAFTEVNDDTLITNIEVKAGNGYFSSMPKDTRMHNADLIIYYSIKYKRYYVYYFDHNGINEYINVWSSKSYTNEDGKKAIVFPRRIKILPTGIKVEELTY